MYKPKFLFLFFIFNYVTGFSQDSSSLKRINIIITIDDKLTFDIRNIKVIDKEGLILGNIEYHPGCLMISDLLYYQIFESDKLYNLNFEHITNSNREEIDIFNVEINHNVLNQNNEIFFFCVISIYTRNDKKNKRRFKYGKIRITYTI